MRMFVRFTLPVDASNEAIKNGSLKATIEKTIAALKPEAAYFMAHDGMRSGFMVFDMKDPSDIPSIAEPFFLGMNAAVEFAPVMNAEDLAAGLEKAAKTF